MRTRYKKLMALLLTAAMLVSTQTGLVFGAEVIEEPAAGELAEVVEEAGAEDFLAEDAVAEAAGAEDVVEVMAAGDSFSTLEDDETPLTPAVDITSASFNAVEHPEWFAPYFMYYREGSTSNHISAGKSIEISQNGGEEGTWRSYLGTSGNYAAVSSNVVTLGDDAALLVIYGIYGGDLNGVTNYPMTWFDGRKLIQDNKKESKKSNNSLWVHAALVSLEEGKVPALVRNSLSMNSKNKSEIIITAAPKNNLHASVSLDAISSDGFHPEIENIHMKSGEKPYFTIKVKLNNKEDKKAYGKALATAMKEKTEYPFEIAQTDFFDWTAVDSRGYNLDAYGGVEGLCKNYMESVSQVNYTSGWTTYMDPFSRVEALSTTVKKEDLKLTWWGGEGSFGDWYYKLKKAKNGKAGDYTTETITVGDDEVLVVLPAENSDFNGYGLTFRNAYYTPAYAKKEISQLRFGIYLDEKNYFVLSE